MSMKNSNDIIGNRSRNLPGCSAVPQPLRHRVPQRDAARGMKIYVNCKVAIYLGSLGFLLIVNSTSGLETFRPLRYSYLPEDSSKDGIDCASRQLCMYVCIYICMYICRYLGIYCMYVSPYVCMYLCTYICKYLHKRECAPTKWNLIGHRMISSPLVLSPYLPSIFCSLALSFYKRMF
jgi:hypothetical protein